MPSSSSSYRLRADVLRRAAGRYGDHSIGSILRRTGFNKTAFWRVLKGDTEPSTGTLMRLYTCYGVPIHELLYAPGNSGDSTEEEAA